MGRRKTGEEHIRLLTKIGGGSSYSVTIPMDYIEKLKWRAGQKLDVLLEGNKVIIRDWKE